MRKPEPLFLPIVLLIALATVSQFSISARAATPRPNTLALMPRPNLLNEVGKLIRTVSPSEIGSWRRELARGHAAPARAARLHLWLGEIEIAKNKEPDRALAHFRQVMRIADPRDPVYSCAGYDRAVTLFLEGAFDLAGPAFQDLLRFPHTPGSYPLPCVALWYRHARACAGYHAKHAKLGITEPPRLDPLCGVASLAACLRANNRPYDRKTLLAYCRMTGLGNSMQDLRDGAKRMGMSAQIVKADADGLKALPMPVVAYVELDHFVAVTRADANGVSYLCSDCGAWPGGRRDLTWKQWRAMDCNLFLTVTRPGSAQDRALQLLTPASGVQRSAFAWHRVQWAATSTAGAGPLRLMQLLGTHILRFDSPCSIYCGQQATSCECPDDTNCTNDDPNQNNNDDNKNNKDNNNNDNSDDSNDDNNDDNNDNNSNDNQGSQGNQDNANAARTGGGSGGGGGGGAEVVGGGIHCYPGNLNCDSVQGSGDVLTNSDGSPQYGDPVDLASGEEHYHPAADLKVYNPIGPNVVWRRRYGSLRGPYNAGGLYPYAQFSFGSGWNSDYDYQAVLVNGIVNLYDPRGGAYTFTVPSTPTATTPQVSCTANLPGTSMLCSYNHNSDGSLSFVFTRPDRSQWSFSSTVGYALSRITDCNGNSIKFLYNTPGSSAGYALAVITDNNNSPLLTIKRNSSFNIVSVTDRYGRSVVYQIKSYLNIGIPNGFSQFSDELIQVSQVARAGVANPPYRFRYGYQYNTNGEGSEMLPTLHQITVPSPTGSGSSTATINYNGIYVASLVDGNGYTRSYTTLDASDTLVTVTNQHKVVYSYTVGYDSQMRITYRTDGTNVNQTYQVTYMPDNAFRPASVTDGNGHTKTFAYDSFGHITALTTPRNVTTTYTWSYTTFPLGELTQVQVGTKTPTLLTYYEPGGLLNTLTYAMPGTAGSAQTVTRTFTYDSLGNLLTVMSPGNDTTSSITLTANYTQDGSYTQSAAIGQPLTITDNLGNVTHYRYDAQGNVIARIGALGNETDFAYNLANQRTRRLVPAVGDVTNLLTFTHSALTYSATARTYNGTITLTNRSNQSLRGVLLLAITNLPPGVSVANTTRTYVNSPAWLTQTLSLASGAKISITVSFRAPAANRISYGIQAYLTDSSGHPAVLPSETRSVYLYPGGPLVTLNIYDESGALYRQIRYRYGNNGELVARSGSIEPITYTYDALYRRQTLADGNGNVTRYRYNAAGWLASITYPGGEKVQFPDHDATGRILKRIDGRGIETDYTYNDPESKLTSIRYVNNANYPTASLSNVTMDYDSYGRTQDVYDSSGSRHFAYDDLNNRTEIDTTYTDGSGNALPTISLLYAFNPDGSRHQIIVQTPLTGYNFLFGYDGAGRPSLLTNPFNETTRWSYLSNDWLAGQQGANNVLAQYAYNQRGLANDISYYNANGALVSDFGAFAYDVNGNPLTGTATIPNSPALYSGQTVYTYDFRDALIQEQSSRLNGYNETFRYDLAGNALNFLGQSHSYNADDQITDVGYLFDADGNPISYGGTALTFDPENRMVAFGSVMMAGYRADGLRAWKASASGRTYYIYDGIQPFVELDNTGNLSAINTFGPFGLLSRHTTAGSVFYTMDALGNVSQRLDAFGNPLTTGAFDGYGNAGNSAIPPDPFGFGASWGYVTDNETALVLLAHRYYSPALGRFLTRDPTGTGGGINLYNYAHNRPTYGGDPTGNRSTGAILGRTDGTVDRRLKIYRSEQ